MIEIRNVPTNPDDNTTVLTVIDRDGNTHTLPTRASITLDPPETATHAIVIASSEKASP